MSIKPLKRNFTACLPFFLGVPSSSSFLQKSRRLNLSIVQISFWILNLVKIENRYTIVQCTWREFEKKKLFCETFWIFPRWGLLCWLEDFSELKAIFQEGIFNVQSALNWTFQSFYPPLKMSKSQARLDIMYRSKRGISWTFLILCVFWNTNTILRLHYKFTHCKSGESISRTLVLEPVYIGVSTNSFPFVPFFLVLATVGQTLAYFAYIFASIITWIFYNMANVLLLER